MRPKQYPYSGEKKQPDKQIAKLKQDIYLLKSDMDEITRKLSNY